MSAADLDTLLREARTIGAAVLYSPEPVAFELVPEPAEGAPIVPYPCDESEGT